MLQVYKKYKVLHIQKSYVRYLLRVLFHQSCAYDVITMSCWYYFWSCYTQQLNIYKSWKLTFFMEGWFCLECMGYRGVQIGDRCALWWYLSAVVSNLQGSSSKPFGGKSLSMVFWGTGKLSGLPIPRKQRCSLVWSTQVLHLCVQRHVSPPLRKSCDPGTLHLIH